MTGGRIITVYLAGVGLIWLGAAAAMKGEPTTHGQDVLSCMGCLLGIAWPVAIAYFVIASPWIALQWWQSRGER